MLKKKYSINFLPIKLKMHVSVLHYFLLYASLYINMDECEIYAADVLIALGGIKRKVR